MPDNSMNTVNARIKSKYDTLVNWIQSSRGTDPFIPLQGEICVVEIPSTATIADTQEENQSQMAPPAIAMKVGDGEHTFIQLPWIQGVAGDVYAWAKQPSIVNDITRNDLAALVSGQIQDTNTLYKIVQGTGDDVNKYYLQKKEVADSAYSYVDMDGNDPVPFLDLTTALTADNIPTLDIGEKTTGTLSVARGGTGATTFPAGEVLVGNGTNAVTTKAIDSTVTANSQNLVTSGAVASAIANIAGAMHFIGISTTTITDGGTEDPTISGTSVTDKKPGDVVLYQDGTNPISKEFVWTGSAWELLGDEGSYVVKGSITDSDIAATANISTSKISGLDTALNNISLVQDGSDQHKITFTSASGETKTITIPDDDTTYTFAEGTTDGAFSVTPSGGTAQSVQIHGLAAAAYKDVDTTVSSGSTNVPTSSAVATAIDNAIDDVSIYELKEGSETTVTGNIKYLVFDCGSASLLID